MHKSAMQFFIAFITGAIVPLLIGYVFIKINYAGDAKWTDLLAIMKKMYLLANLVFIAILPNLIAVFILYHFDKWNYLRGIFVSIMLYIALAFWL
jgi:hypothetical protein